LITNVYDCVQSVVRGGTNLNVKFPPKFDPLIAKLADEFLDRTSMTSETYEIVQEFIKTPEFEKVFAMRDQYWILDNAQYFLQNVPRFNSPAFYPSLDEFLLARAKTTGIVETSFELDNPRSHREFDQKIKFLVVDVGGQRNERRKWMYVFEDVKAVVYVVNLAGYSMVLYEDESRNRMNEALDLFRETARTLFKDIPVLILLNKTDLFEQTLKTTPLTKCFPDYTGPNEPQAGIEYIFQVFKNAAPATSNLLGYRAVSARSTEDLQAVFRELTSQLLDIHQARIEANVKRILGEDEVKK